MRKKCTARGNKRKAFTMIELVMVIVAIAVISAISIPKIMFSQSKAQLSQVLKSDLETIVNVVMEWKSSSTTSDGSFRNLNTSEIAVYLPTNMAYDTVNNEIESSGYSGNCKYSLAPDKLNNDGDTFKIFMDCSTANFSTELNQYAERKFSDTMVSFSSKRSAISRENANAIGGSNSDFTNSGNNTDGIGGVRQIKLQ